MKTEYGMVLDDGSTIELNLENNSYDLDLSESINPGESSDGQNYENLRNKPSINSIELIGNLTTEDLKLDYGALPNKPTINSRLVDGDLTLEDFGVGTATVTDINKLFNSDYEDGSIPNNLKNITTIIFNTIADVINKANNFENGTHICTRGYYAPGDEGAAIYKIVSLADPEKPWQISIGGGKYLEIAETKRVTYRMFGAKLDGETDDGAAIKNCHDYANSIQYLEANGKTYIYPCKVENHQGIIYKRNNVPIYAYTDVDLSGSTIIMDDYNSAWFGFYVWGNNSINSYSFDMGNELISSMKKDNARLKFDENMILPPNTVVYFDEKPYSMRNNGENYYTVERMELMVHKQDGWCATPFCDDWSDGVDLFSVEVGEQNTVNVYGIKQAWYNFIPSTHGTFIGCYVKYKCSNPNTTSAVLLVRRHNCTVSDFTFEPGLDQLQNSLYKNASIYVYGCYNVTIKNIFGLNNAGKRLANNTNATSGYIIRLFGCDTVNIDRCDLAGFWGAIAASQVKSLTIRDTKSNRLDVHDGIYNCLIDNCTLYSHALQIGYGRGNLTVNNCKFYFSYQDDDCYQTPHMLALQATYGRIFSGKVFIRNCDAYCYMNPSENTHSYQIVRVSFDDTSQSLIEHYEYPELNIESVKVWSDDPEHTNLFYSYVLGTRTAKSGYMAPSLATNELLDNTIVWNYIGRSYDFINGVTVDTRTSLSTGHFIRCIRTMSDESGTIVLGIDYFKVISGGTVGDSQPINNETTILWGECQLQYISQDNAEWKSNHNYTANEACIVSYGIYIKGYCFSCKIAGKSNGQAPIHTSGTMEDNPGENLESITWEYIKTFDANEYVKYSPGMTVTAGQYIEYNDRLIYVISGGTLTNSLMRFKWFEYTNCGSAVLQQIGIKWQPHKWIPNNGYCINESKLYHNVSNHDGTTSGALLQNPSGRLIDGKIIWQALSETPISYTIWSQRTEYTVGDCVQINGNYYQCISNGRLLLPKYFYFGDIKTNAVNQYGWVFDGNASVATAQKSGMIITKIQDSDLTNSILNYTNSTKPFGKDDNPDITCYVRTSDEMEGVAKDMGKKYYAKIPLSYDGVTARTRIMLPYDTIAGIYRIDTVCTISTGAAIGISVSDNTIAQSIAANGHAYLKMPAGNSSSSAGKQIIFAVYPGSANSGIITIIVERTNITDDVTNIDIDFS